MNVLELDRLPAGAPNGAADGWVVHVVLANGDVATRAVVRFDTAAGTVTVSRDLPGEALTGAMCVLSSAALGTTLWRVLEVAELDGVKRKISARRHHPGRYAAVETALNLDTLVLDGLAGFVAPPAAVALNEQVYDDGVASRSNILIGVQDPEGGRDARVTGIDYEIRPPGEDWQPVVFQPGGVAEIPDVRPGTYRARAKYLALSGAIRSAWTESADLTVSGFPALAAPAGFAVTAVAEGYTASWTPPTERDYAYTEILDRLAGGAAAVRGRSTTVPWPRLGLSTAERLVSIRHVDRDGRRTAASAELAVTPQEAPEGPPGRPGDDGEDGAPGRDGEDGQGREDIFCLTAAGDSPPAPNDAWGFDSRPRAPDSPGAGIWYDDEPETTAALPLAWHAWRGVAGTPAVGTSPYETGTTTFKEGFTAWRSPGISNRYAYSRQGRTIRHRGAWSAAGVEYRFDTEAPDDGTAWYQDAVEHNGSQYYCILTHTSAPSSEPGTAGGIEEWRIAVRSGDVRGASWYNVAVTPAQMDTLEAAGDTLPAAFVAIANDTTPGENKFGDFVNFYVPASSPQRGSLWSWNHVDTLWVPVTPFIAAQWIAAGAIKAIHIEANTITAEHVTADVRNVVVLNTTETDMTGGGSNTYDFALS